MTGNEEDFASMLAEFEASSPNAGSQRTPQVGDTVQGPVVSIGQDAVFVEIGSKSEAMLDLDQVSDADGNITVKLGDVIEARVVDNGRKTGCVVLRRAGGRGSSAPEELAMAFQSGLPVSGMVTGLNKGGAEVQIGAVRAFCPVSQLDIRFVEDPEVFVGRKLDFRITRLEPGRGSNLNLVVSRKALLQEEARERAIQTRATLAVGSVLSGTVTSIKPYGAFVDIGGLEGMLHISELGHTRVENPADVLSEGQSVEVQVIKIEQTGDAKRPEKIGLSLKSLERDPWMDIADRFPAGTRVRGKVVRSQPFGAFVEIAPGVEGLIHISELGVERRVNHPREVVTDGQEVDVKILSVDKAKRRISLSIGALADDEERAIVEAAAPLLAGNKSLGTLGDLLKKKIEE